VTLSNRRVMSEVEPGYIRPLLSETAPEEGEGWPAVMADLERVIMPGITHWNHPQFHAYFPTASSYPALVADMLSDAISCLGFSWVREKSVSQSTRFGIQSTRRLVLSPDSDISGFETYVLTPINISGKSESQDMVT
jgi:glutamate/tyrosine decarboxylase-like PLP-dependent enzyme